MGARIIGIAGPLKGRTLDLPEGEVSIGREPVNQLSVPDPALSRQHCILTRTGSNVTIRDAGSRNGTKVNGRHIQQAQELHHQDRITIGESTLVFLHLAAGDPTPTPSDLEITSTAVGVTSSLREEDALYLHPEKLSASDPSARLVHDLNTLLKIANGIGGIRDKEALLWQLLGMILDVMPAAHGAVVLLDDNGDPASVAAWDRANGPGHPVPLSRTLLKKVVEERAGMLASAVAPHPVLGKSASLADADVQSLLCVPLVAAGKVLGVIYVGCRDHSLPFDNDHLQLLAGIAGIASLAFDNVRHFEQLREDNRLLHAEVAANHDMIGDNAAMRAVYDLIRRVAATDSTVLIQGESGTGKELVARAIHASSRRADGPFVAINCAAITDTLLESELFGHEKGAFTGAIAQKKGKLEIANRGTLFLDEIGELAPALQAKLLRVLQEREFEHVGGTRSLKADVRVVAATNRNLAQAVEEGAFRRDLYYRLKVVALTVPPLRDRKEDIPALAENFILRAARKCHVRPKPLSPAARACLVGYDWPGNVRELENAIERAIVLGSADSVLPEDLPEEIYESEPADATTLAPTATSSNPAPSALITPTPAQYQNQVKDRKKQLIQSAMTQANGNYLEAAKALGLHPNSLLRLIRNLKLKETTE